MLKLRFLMVALLLPPVSHANPLFCWGKCQEAKEAYAYFDKLCREKAFTRIYKHVKDVDSILRVNGEAAYLYRDPKRDINVPNAYGLARDDGEEFYGAYDGLLAIADVVEVPVKEGGTSKVRRYTKDRAASYNAGYTVVEKSTSRYAYQWVDITTPEMRRHWVAGSHYKFIDLATGGVLGEHVGFTVGIERSGRVNNLIWAVAMPSCDTPVVYKGRRFGFSVLEMWKKIEQGE